MWYLVKPVYPMIMVICPLVHLVWHKIGALIQGSAIWETVLGQAYCEPLDSSASGDFISRRHTYEEYKFWWRQISITSRVQGIWCNRGAPSNWLISFRICAISRVQTGLCCWHARQASLRHGKSILMRGSLCFGDPMLWGPCVISIVSTHSLFMRSFHQHWLNEEMGWLISQDLTVKGCFYSRWPFEHEETQRSASFVPTYMPMDLFMYLFTRPPCLRSSNCFFSRLLSTKPSATQESCIYTAQVSFPSPTENDEA